MTRLPDGAAVLVTRPQGQAGPLSEAIEAAGGTAIRFPALAIEALDPGEATAIDDADTVVFVSPNAVEFGHARIDPAAGQTIAAIGPGTAAALANVGLAAGVVPAGGFTSRDLLAEQSFAGDLAGRRIAIIRGEDGRAELGDELTARGAEVNYIAVYKRVLPEIEESVTDDLLERWRSGEIRAVTLLSSETLANLDRLLGARGIAELSRTPVVTISRGVLQTLRERSPAARVELAERSDPDAIVTALAGILSAGDNENPMTEDRNNEVPAATDEGTATTLAETPHDEPPPEEPRGTTTALAARRGTPLVAWLALLLALLALALTAWQWQDGGGGDDPEAAAAFAARLSSAENRSAEANRTLDELREEIAALTSQQALVAGELAQLARDAGERRDLVESLPGRVENVESALGAMQGIAAGSRADWLLSEAEYYLQLANAQLQLGRNPTLAAYGLELADERVRQLSDPVYTPVRRALAREIQALRALAATDTEGVSLRLAGISETIDELPLAARIEPVGTSDDTLPAPAGEGRLARAWQAVTNVASDLVSVRRTDEAVTPMLSPEASYFLRTNLALKFDVARLALLRGEAQEYTQSLDDAADWLSRYFDVESEAVRSTLASIAELRDTDVRVQFPDITQSLRLLRERTAIRGLDVE